MKKEVRNAFFLYSLFILIIILIWFGYYWWRGKQSFNARKIAYAYESKISIGMSRDDALIILNEKAVQHRVCHYKENERELTDIYYFGSLDLDIASAIAINSEKISSNFVIKGKNLLSESFNLAVLYNYCQIVQPSK